MNHHTFNEILSVYLLIGFALAIVVVRLDENKKYSKLDKTFLFLSTIVGWFFAFCFPIHEKVGHTDGFIIEKLGVAHDINTPVYPSGSFVDGTSKLTVVDV